ncbi:hypothetical protein ACFS5J_06835 [Flavobacterium chuncheonense]|uniref:Uncharacterized protein n=1 Tax=Flavobacterium chuncheonense TaxID=2026653 RepID=A0ABW5YL02_9FLAO
MSLVRNVHELQISTKTALLSVFGQAHYFLIAFFLFKHNMVDQVENPFLLDFDFYMIILTSLVFSLVWFIVNICISSILPIYSIQPNASEKDVYFSSMSFSIGCLTLALILTFLLDSNFYIFIAFAYMFIAFKIVWSVFKLMFNK